MTQSLLARGVKITLSNISINGSLHTPSINHSIVVFCLLGLAASNPNSGSLAPWPLLNTLQDPSHVASVMTMHGAQGVDAVVIDFADVSVAMGNDVKAKGGFAVDCDHGGGHGMAPKELKTAGWEFMKAHPYGIKPSPYAGGLPASFPSYCKIL